MKIQYFALLCCIVFNSSSGNADQKPIVIECRSSARQLQSARPNLFIPAPHVQNLVPSAPEPSFFRKAPSMYLSSQGEFTYPRMSSIFEIHYRYSVEQPWPQFDESGKWINLDSSVQLSLSVLVKEVFPDGKTVVIGGSDSYRSIHFDEKGIKNEHDVYLSTTVFSPKIYQMAFDFPNQVPSNPKFPHEHFDLDWNKKIREMLEAGTLSADEFLKFEVLCRFDY